MMAKRPVVLFISRRFPPSRGGMERFAAELSQALVGDCVVIPVVWTGQKRWQTVAALPILFVRGLIKVLNEPSITVIHSQDAVTAPLAWLLAKLSRRPYVTVIHGLDVTYAHPLYGYTILPFVRWSTRVVANSAATAQVGKQLGIRRIKVIPPGVHKTTLPIVDRMATLQKLGLEDQARAKILLTVGRLVERKGVEWFILNALPDIVAERPKLCYVVVGEGPRKAAIMTAIKKAAMQRHVRMLGSVDDDDRQRLYSVSDIFVMPNIKIANDMEGFGIVAQEAALAEVPVVASRLEGITDAIEDGKNGYLVSPADPQAFASTITQLLSHSGRRAFGRRARRYTQDRFDWSHIALQFRELYTSLPTPKSAKKALKTVLATLIICLTLLVVGSYLSTHPRVLEPLARLPIGLVMVIGALYLVVFVALSMILYFSIRLFDKKLSLRENLLLNAYSTLTNFFGPGQSGSGIRAIYLKAKLGLTLKSFFLASLIYYAYYTIVSVLMLLAGAGKWWQASAIAIVVGMISIWLVQRYKQRADAQLVFRPLALIGILAGTLLQIGSLVLIYYLETMIINREIRLSQAISYTGAANLSLFIALTPAAIGIREALLVLTQSLHHVQNATIIAAGVVDRAVYVVYLGVLFVIVSLMHGKERLAKLRRSSR